MSDTPLASAAPRPVPIAPAPNGRTQSEESRDADTHMLYTCLTCSKRKVKCDKIAPVCGTCRKARLECEYQEPAPRRKRKRNPADDVHEKLEQYETLLKQNGLLPKDETTPVMRSIGAPSFSSPFYTTKHGTLGEKADGKLLTDQGKTRYIDSGIWRNLGENDFHPSDEEDEGESEPTPRNQPTADPISSVLLGAGSPSSDLIVLHPTYDSALKLWKIYVDNIDPIVKVVHVPTGLAMLQRAASNPSSASRTTEALLFAIYHFALTSISDGECQKLFGEPQSKLIARYHDAVRQALVNASFMRTTDITLLQAYMLFLLSVRNRYDPHTFWILTGVAVRIGQRMGIHRDGEEYNLNPFDVQMRRRIFWQLLPLDGLAGQLCGTGICISPDSYDTKQPLNINDADIWPDMPDPPTPRTGATDIMFCLARTEMPQKFFSKRINAPWGGKWDDMLQRERFAEKEQQLVELEEEMETKYLRYCDFAIPLHNLVMAFARTAINVGKLRIRLPRVKAPTQLSDEDRDEIWSLAHKILDADIAAHNNLSLSRFMWHLQAFFQWDPLIFILNEICRNPVAHQDDQVTWTKIGKVYENHPTMLTQRRALHVALWRLTLKAWDAYQSCRTYEQASQPEPYFITSIRSLSNRRDISRSSSTLTPAYDHNLFNPMIDTSEDLRSSNYSNMAWNTNEFDFKGMGDFNFDSTQLDWMFWDQLVRDPTSFPAS